MPHGANGGQVDWIGSLVMVAQEAADQAADGNDGGGSFASMMLPMMAIMLLFYFMIIVPQKKEQQDRADKLKNIKEKAHVITTGGIYGVVTNVQADAGRVTLRVDDSTGTKIKVSLQAIAKVLGDDDKSDAKDK